MSFGTILQKLLTNGNVKNVQLAHHLDYDVSYISRWLHDTKLPAVKEQDPLFFDIVSYILVACKNSERTSIISAFSLPSDISDEMLKKKLVDLLTHAYWQQREQKKRQPNEVHSFGNSFLAKSEIIYDNNLELLCNFFRSKSLSYPGSTFEIISAPSNAGFQVDECQHFWNSLLKSAPNCSIQVKLVLSESYPLQIFDVCRDICIYCGGLPEEIKFFLYCAEALTEPVHLMWSCRDTVLLMSLSIPFQKGEHTLITRDASLVTDCYHTLENMLRKRTPLFLHASLPNLYSQGFFEGLLLGTRLSIVYTSMPVFSPANSQGQTPAEMKLAAYLFEENQNPMRIILFRGSLLQYVSYSSDMQISASQRAKQLAHLADSIEKKSDCELIILNDTNPWLCRSHMQATLLSNDTHLCFLKPSASGSPVAQYSTDPNLTECFQHFVKHLGSLSASFMISGASALSFIRRCVEQVQGQNNSTKK